MIAIVCGGMIGYRASTAEQPPLFYEIVLALVISCTLYLFLDIEYPRFGLVRLDTTNLLLLDLANSMQYTQTT